MSIFEGLFRRKKQPPKLRETPEPVEPLPVEPLIERPKTLLDVGWDVIESMKLNPEERKKLYNSLEREERTLLGRGSLFVSGAECDYFFKVMKGLNVRPVILFDFENIENPSRDLVRAIEEYGNKPKALIVFVKNYFQDRADQLDPNGDFDNGLREQVQNGSWAAVIHGGRHSPGLSGNIAGSSRSTELAITEETSKK